MAPAASWPLKAALGATFRLPEPFEADELIRLVGSLERNTEFKEWHETYLPNRRKVRWREEPVNIAGISEKLEYKTPGVAANADRYRNRLRGADLNIIVAAKALEEKEAAQRVENFFYLLYDDLRAESDLDDEALDFQAADGVGIRNLDWSDDVLDKLFSKTRNIDDIVERVKAAFSEGFDGNPFKLRVPNPDGVYFHRDQSMVAEIGPVFVSELRLAYEGRLDGDEGVEFDEIVSDVVEREAGLEQQERTAQFYHIETKEYVYEAISNADHSKSLLLRVYPNPVGEPRYTFAVGHRTSGTQPWKKFRPLIDDLYPTAQRMNITGTLLLTAALQSGRPTYQQVKVGSQADDFMSILSRPAEDQNIVSIDTSKGEFLDDPKPGYEWKQVPPPDVSVVRDAHEQMRIDFEEYGFPRALSPSPDVSGSSGYHEAKMMEGAQDFLEPALENVARAWRKLFLQAANAIKKLDVPVTIRAVPRAEGKDRRVQEQVTIKPEDFKDIRIRVEFKSMPAGAQFVADEANRRDVELGFMSETTYMETKYDDPERERKQVALDKMRRAAEEQAMGIALAYLEQEAQKKLQAVLGQAQVPVTMDEPADPARPASGAAPAVGAPPVPPPQTQNGETPPPAESGAIGVAQ